MRLALRVLHVVCFTLLAAGCGALLPSMPSPRDFLLEYPPPPPFATRLPVILRLAPVRAAAVYDREPIAYSPAPYRVGYYHYHRWVTAPSQMITDLLARDFLAAEAFRAVQLGPSVLAADYQLDVRLDRLEERIEGQTCTAVLVLRASLQDLHGRGSESVVLQKRYEQSNPVPCKTPAALPAAFSRALQEISTALVRDVCQTVASLQQKPALSLSAR